MYATITTDTKRSKKGFQQLELQKCFFCGSELYYVLDERDLVGKKSGDDVYVGFSCPKCSKK